MNNIINNLSKLDINKSPYKKWIKVLTQANNILFTDYNNKKYFNPVANVLIDTDINLKTNLKKRKTLIKFQPIIQLKEFNSKEEWLYIFTINDYIVKIGGTRCGLKNRCTSYLCGHHIVERGKSGSCSSTNAIIYNTFYYHLHNNMTNEIKMYGYKLPKITTNINILENTTIINLQTYHAYESSFLNNYKKTYGIYPLLNSNRDPEY